MTVINAIVATDRTVKYTKEVLTFLIERYPRFSFSSIHDTILVTGASVAELNIINKEAEAFDAGFVAGVSST